MELFGSSIVDVPTFTRSDRWRTVDIQLSFGFTFPHWPFPAEKGAEAVQGVVKLYDPVTQDGVVITDVDMAEYDLAPGALTDSVFRMLRPGQRVVFDLDDAERATSLRLGSEEDMATPAWLMDADES
ncbi:MAG: hypothetical protein AAF467_21750 [Actinomycetota bacterium]